MAALAGAGLHLRIYEWLNQKTAMRFLDDVLAKLPFRVEVVQTDNGAGFQSRIHHHVLDRGIGHVFIRPATPRLHGKVERSHRIDADEFYRAQAVTGERVRYRPDRIPRLAAGKFPTPGLKGPSVHSGRRAIVGVLGLALVVAACGSSSTSPTKAPTAAATAASRAPASDRPTDVATEVPATSMPSDVSAGDTCRFLTAAEVGSVMTATIASTTPASDAGTCDYNTGSGESLVTTSYDASNAAVLFPNEAFQTAHAMVKIPGVGDAAVYYPATGEIDIEKGSAWMKVLFAGMNSEIRVDKLTVPQRIDLLTKLGTLAAGRM